MPLPSYEFDHLSESRVRLSDLHSAAAGTTINRGGAMEDVVVSLTLNHEERELIREILEERQRTFWREISHTDHYEFKVALRKKAQILESVLNRFAVHA
jgi:hypothetical protein